MRGGKTGSVAMGVGDGGVGAWGRGGGAYGLAGGLGWCLEFAQGQTICLHPG